MKSMPAVVRPVSCVREAVARLPARPFPPPNHVELRTLFARAIWRLAVKSEAMNMFVRSAARLARVQALGADFFATGRGLFCRCVFR